MAASKSGKTPNCFWCAQFPHTSWPKRWRLPQFLGIKVFCRNWAAPPTRIQPLPKSMESPYIVIDTISKYVNDSIFKYCTNILYSLFVNVFQLYVHPFSYTGQCVLLCWQMQMKHHLLPYCEQYPGRGLPGRVEVPAGPKNKGWITYGSSIL